MYKYYHNYQEKWVSWKYMLHKRQFEKIHLIFNTHETEYTSILYVQCFRMSLHDGDIDRI